MGILLTVNAQTMKPLTPDERRIIVDKGTEAPFTGKYYKHSERGLYRCRQCQQFSLTNTACRMNRCDAWFTDGQGAGFIKRHLRDHTQLFQRGPAFD